MVPFQLQPNIALASGLVDHLFFCRLMLELASGKTTVMGEAGDGWFSLFFILTNFVCKYLYRLYLISYLD